MKLSGSRRGLLLPVLAVTGALSVLTACSSGSGDSGSGASTSESAQASSTPSASPSVDDASFVTPRGMPDGKGSGQADGVFPRTVVHFSGSTTLDAEPQKVVVISTGQADVLLTLGVVPAGSTAGDGADMIPQYLFDAFPQDKAALDAVVDVGSRFAPDLETVANVKPDLIVMNAAGKDAQTLYGQLKAIAPTVTTQGTGLYWKQDFLLLADALGRTEQAQTWLDDYQSDAAELGASLTTVPTVSFLRLNADRLRVFGVASFSGSVAEDAGLKRPQSQAFTDETSVDISKEQLDQADADWLFYGVQGGDDTKLTGAALWPTLTVVAADQAVSVDDDIFYLNTGPTAARGILTVLTDTLTAA